MIVSFVTFSSSSLDLEYANSANSVVTHPVAPHICQLVLSYKLQFKNDKINVASQFERLYRM